jgi:hypothetical protein
MSNQSGINTRQVQSRVEKFTASAASGIVISALLPLAGHKGAISGNHLSRMVGPWPIGAIRRIMCVTRISRAT